MARSVHEQAKSLLLAARERIRQAFPELLDGNEARSFEDLRAIAESIGIRVVEDEDLPGNLYGIAMNVEGFPFIVLDLRSRALKERSFVLAHELSHVVLGHLELPNFSSPFLRGNTIRSAELTVIQSYSSDQEQQADLAGLELLLPESYLDGCVERFVWIPTRIEARRRDEPTHIYSARVEVYRLMNGYDRTFELAQQRRDERQKYELSIGGQVEDGKRLEMADQGALECFLASAGSYSYIRRS